jgi:hypothetical protein
MPETTLLVDGKKPNQRYKEQLTQMNKDFSEWEDLMRDVSTYIALGKGRFTGKGDQPNKRVNKAVNIINNTATRSLHLLGAGIQGGLSSHARQWFQLALEDADLGNFHPHRVWLDTVEKVMYSVFNKSNFYKVIPSIYEEIAGFGTGCVFVMDHPTNYVNFIYFTAGDYRFSVNEDGMPFQIMRDYKLQVHQMVQQFGLEKCSDTVQKQWNNNEWNQWKDIIHVIEPNLDRDPGLQDQNNMPWRSIYFEKNETDKQLRKSGFWEQPAVCPRWQALSNYSYGWGPGFETLGSSKMLQRVQKNIVRLTDKAADPPYRVPPSMSDRALNLTPGGKNFAKKDETIEPIQKVELNGLRMLRELADDIKADIERNFMNDLFLLIVNQPAASPITATEVMERKEEKLQMIGPAIESLLHENLDPIVKRVFNIVLRRGIVPLPPPEMQGAGLKIDYISLLAQAQKLITSQSLHAYLGLAERVALLEPQSVIKTDWDEFLETSHDTVGAPAKIIRSKADAEAIRQQMAEAQAKQAQLEETMAQTESIKSLGSAKTDTGTALADIKEE